MTVLFRACQESDLRAVQLLVDQLYVSDPNTQEVRPNIVLTFRELTRSPEKGRLIVFASNDEIVGYCIIIFFWSNEYGGNIIEIDEICVVENRLRSGIGTELIKWLEETFADNLAGFSLQVAHHNHAALKFVNKMGFSISRNQHLIKVMTR